MKTVMHFYAVWTDPSLRPTAIRVALVVGSILFVINHGSAIVKGEMSRDRWIAGLATYLIPYTVSIHGQYTQSKKLGRLPGLPPSTFVTTKRRTNNGYDCTGS